MSLYKTLLDRVFSQTSTGTLKVTYWDGETRTYGQGKPCVELKLHKSGIVPGLVFNPELAFGEAYMRGDLEVIGTMEEFMVVSGMDDPSPGIVGGMMNLIAALANMRGLSMLRHRRDVSHHYDLGNDFYRLWLDPTMTYSCGYFRSPEETLETAQRDKIRHTLNKLRLQPGETLVDIGCGWGGLITDAATHFGVKALGITLSEAQRDWFLEQSRPPDTQAQVRLEHYHSLAQEGSTFDKLVSVGMAEHVGKRNLPGYFASLKRLLKPGGLGLVHCITYLEEAPTNPWILKYIFPGGYIPSFREVVSGLTDRGFILWDAENIGPHYALTLDKWAENFERNVEWVKQKYGEEFVRMWRLYLRYSAASFRCEDVYVHQVLFSNGKPAELPLTREGVYRE